MDIVQSSFGGSFELTSIENNMTDPGGFKDARILFAGAVSGADDNPHLPFRLEGPGEAPHYGEYAFLFDQNGSDFNIEIGPFGYSDERYLGLPHPSVRRSFAAEDCSAIERLIQTFFQIPRRLRKDFHRRGGFWVTSAFDLIGFS
ncbi:MAG TPA: hypothetical protein VIY51_08915 [Xanthobacteraceae bacterium]